MPKDPIIAIRDCLSEIAILHEIAARMTLDTFRSDPVARRAAAYAWAGSCGAGRRGFEAKRGGEIRKRPARNTSCAEM